MTAPAPDSLAATTAIVTGTSRGFGRAVSAALCDVGVRVVRCRPHRGRPRQGSKGVGEEFIPVAGDAADDRLASRLIAEYRPRTSGVRAYRRCR
jgi:NAD(P)-dependent dehydrogenase (short-subunit alcohol dehydrogenase family)